MRLPRKTLYALLLFLCALNLVARYPRTPHELGFDGFVYHGMAVSLIQLGHADWVLTPLSYFGLYPLSHPSGSFFFLADLSQLAGTPVEGAILLFDMALVALSLLSGFLLSMEIRRDEGLALLVAAMFSLSPRLVSSLLWEVPTRTLFSALVPLLIWLLLRLHRTQDKRSLAFVVIVLAVMMSAHRLTVLMAAVFIAFILTEIVIVGVRTLRIRYASLVLRPQFRRTANLAVLIGFFALSISLITVGGILGSYGTGRAGFGSGVLFELSNLGVSLARSAGFLIPVVPLGVVAVYRQRLKDFKEPFLLMILLVLLPTLTLRQYTGYYIVAVTAPFIGLGIWALIQAWRLRDRPTEEPIPMVARHPFWLTAGFLFVAEFGDKTQIAVIVLAATAAAPFSVFAGASLAEALVAVTSVFIGTALSKALAARWIEGASTVLFLIAGTLLILEALSII